MTERMTVTAVYENGILRPMRRLHLRERQTVQIQILSQDPEDTPERRTEAERELESILQSLEAAGLLEPPSGDWDGAPTNDCERRALAEELGRAPGKPLSEIILEDRGLPR
jgi:predicted DNA-binding antitoxin AbrB/MazE fold protein